TLRIVEHFAADHAHPGAVFAARLARHAVIEHPDIRAALEIPPDPVAIGRVGPIMRAGQSLAGIGLELRLAVIAIANLAARQAGPAIVRKTVRMAALDDLFHYGRQI